MPTIYERHKLNPIIRDKLLTLSPPSRRAASLKMSIIMRDALIRERERVQTQLDAENQHIRKTCTHADKDLDYKETSAQSAGNCRMFDCTATVTCTLCGEVVARHTWYE
jgi:hypothetical protein